MEYIDFIINQVLNERLTAIQLSPDAPFSACDAAMSNFLYANTKGALLFQAVVGDKGSEAALRAVLTELKRMQKSALRQASMSVPVMSMSARWRNNTTISRRLKMTISPRFISIISSSRIR